MGGWFVKKEGYAPKLEPGEMFRHVRAGNFVETAKVLAVEAAHDAAKFEWDWVSSDFAPADTEVEELEDDEEDDEPAPSAA